MIKLTILAAALVGAAGGPAYAQSEEPATTEVNYAVDGAIIGASLVGAYLFSLIPVDTERSWNREMFGKLDKRLRGRFSERASKVSDFTLAATVLTPMFEQLGRDVDERTGERAMIYGETFGLNLLTTAAVKYTVGRPRPYSYEGDHRDKDSYLSFYSGHASIGFSSAVAGSVLYASDSDSRGKSAAAWAFNLTLASATANLRVRAGKHFYSDVLVGALVGSAIGYAVPALHSGDAGVYAPSGLELGAMAGGLVLGTAVSQLMPLESDKPSLTLAPASIKGGTGLALAGSLK